MREIKASVFKAKCLSLMDEVASSGEELVVTKNGKPISKLVPLKTRPKQLFGFHEENWKFRESSEQEIMLGTD